MKHYPIEQRTIGHILADKAQRVGTLPWMQWQDTSISYAELEHMTNRYANSLRALGIQRGDHVAVLLPNGPEFLWLIWGLGKIGAVAVPLNTAAKGELLRYFIDNSDSKWVAIDAEYAPRLAAIAGELPKLHGVICKGGPAEELHTIGRAVIDINELARGSETPPPLDAVKPGDMHLIMYTSGTTGPSKGVMSPHSQGHGVGEAVAANYGYRSDDVLYVCLPLFHGNALWYSTYAALWADASVALAPRFSAGQFWNDIVRMKATQFNSLGAMTNILWKLPPTPLETQHRVRQSMMVPVPSAIYNEFQARYGVAITSVYAMTENFAMTLFTPDDPPEKAGSAGKTRGNAELRVVDEGDRVLAVGEVGEICMKPLHPESMMLGYYKMAEATAREFRGGWFHTGDRGYLDTDGYLYFVDRKKEAIRRRGENISAYEVELILSRHPCVLEAAAVPVSSEMSEDEVMVYVVRQPGASISAEEVVHFCNENMAYYMVPRFVEFIDVLPKTPSEKIEKYKLKQDAQARRESLWDREKVGIQVKR
ncbi:MAG: ATP-dependent acyl-CoA ligase [Rhizobacter sp.]|nr:ATP-dependent acyl-CoA ligase [Rhizobacter sp.]